MPAGAYRRVLLLGRFAFKTPRLSVLAEGMRCNRWEREMWFIWRPKLGWSNLCPVLFADPLGLLVVMPRALQPVTEQELEAVGVQYPADTAEGKPEDYGRINGVVLALDYGLPWKDAVTETRSCYAKHLQQSASVQ